MYTIKTQIMLFTAAIIALVPALAKGQICADDAAFTFVTTYTGVTVNCAWLTKNKIQAEIRIPQYCSEPSIMEACCYTCIPCEDTNGFTFELDYSGNSVGCDFFTKKKTEERTGDYCVESGSFFDADIAAGCIASCGLCSPIPCEDTNGFTFELDHSGNSVGCDFFTQKKTEERTGDYCVESGSFFNADIAAGCVASCGLCSPTGRSRKKGLIIGFQSSQHAVNHFNGSVSWFYNYQHTPFDWQGTWADDNDVEFIPMIPGPWLWDESGKFNKKCFFDEKWGSPLCTLKDVTDVLQDAKDMRINGVEIKRLMGFNEMYNNPPPVGNDLTPKEAALYWRRLVQPAAIATGLELVSPTLNTSNKAVTWFADFLKECYDKRNNSLYPCNVELIKMFAVHQYDCRESIWNDWYGGDNSEMITRLIAKLGDFGGKKNWTEYILDRKLWVTETNCYWEEVIPNPESDAFSYPHPDSKGQCLRITGQMEATHGRGSLVKMEEMENIERYSLWTSWNPQIKPNYLVDKSGKHLTPLGRAYLNPGDKSVDCEFSGTRIYVDDAEHVTLEGNAELFNCESTGTNMVM
jgi:hypothetical protein